MEFISSINDAVNSFVWGAPAIIMIMAVGLFLTFKLKGIQFRNLGFMIKKTYVEAFTKKEETETRGEGQITSFQAAMAAVSGFMSTTKIMVKLSSILPVGHRTSLAIPT